MTEVNHARAQLAYAKAQHKMTARRLEMIRFSLEKNYDVHLAAEAISLAAQLGGLEAQIKTLKGE